MVWWLRSHHEWYLTGWTLGFLEPVLTALHSAMALVYKESKQNVFLNNSSILSVWQVPAFPLLPSTPFPAVWAQGLPEGVAKARSAGDAPATWQLPERPFYRFVVISSIQPKWGVSPEPSVAALLRQWKNSLPEVALGDTAHPSLEEKGPLGSENNYDSFPSAFYFLPPSFSRSLCWTHVSVLLPHPGPSLFPAQQCASKTPQQCISAPPTSAGRFLVAFLLCHLQHVSQLPASGNFHSVLCQVRRFAFTKPRYAFKGLTFAYKQHLLFVSC